ncbi:MAG: flagellar biosynthesis regulator FlaF [Rhodospirillaceae bacterium]|nr:flagellar biosynthesis regulator FlaF [Rhodospirillaceae bacterium]
MSDNRIKAYESSVKRAETTAETDAAVLENAAMILIQAKEVPGHEDFFDALRYNQRIWTVIQTYLVEEENPFPEDIKSNLISLSIFVDKQTYRAMAEASADRLDTLININRQIAAGLREIPPGARQPASSAPPQETPPGMSSDSEA